MRVSRIGVGMVGAELQPVGEIDEPFELETIDLCLFGIRGLGRDTGIHHALRIRYPRLIHSGVDARRQSPNPASEFNSELQIPDDLGLERVDRNAGGAGITGTKGPPDRSWSLEPPPPETNPPR